MSDAPPRQLAVLGSPIGHSQSPALHRAAYAQLGLDWTYRAVEVPSGGLVEFSEDLDETWLGLSLTMPLKREVVPLLARRSELVQRTGVANTVLLDRDGWSGFNTDVYGVVRAFRDAGVDALDSVHILGGGATAASVIAAVAELGGSRADVSTRSPGKSEWLVALGDGVGVDVSLVPEDAATQAGLTAVVSTLPGGTPIAARFDESVRRDSVLLDVAYSPWPSELAREWHEARGTVINGIEMLVLQALAQVRIFVAGNPDVPLPDEGAVLSAMRESVGLPG